MVSSMPRKKDVCLLCGSKIKIGYLDLELDDKTINRVGICPVCGNIQMLAEDIKNEE